MRSDLRSVSHSSPLEGGGLFTTCTSPQYLYSVQNHKKNDQPKVASAAQAGASNFHVLFCSTPGLGSVELPDSMSKLTLLRRLILSGWCYSSLPGIVGRLSQIQELDFRCACPDLLPCMAMFAGPKEPVTDLHAGVLEHISVPSCWVPKPA